MFCKLGYKFVCQSLPEVKKFLPFMIVFAINCVTEQATKGSVPVREKKQRF